MNLVLQSPPGPHPVAGTNNIVCAGERRRGVGGFTIGNRWVAYTATARATALDFAFTWCSWTREP